MAEGATRIRRTQEERSAATRARLLDATIECLIELGYAGTTTTLIAERAGVSRGAQLHHYPTKAELVSAAVDHLAERLGKDLRDKLAQLPPDGDRASAAIDLLWSRFSTPFFPAWLELWVAARTDADLAASLHPVEDRLRRAIQRQVTALFGSQSSDRGARVAELTLYLMQGMMLDRVLGHEGARQRARRESATLTAWKDLVAQVLGGAPVG